MDDNSIILGRDLDNPSQTVALTEADLEGHTFVLAHTGAGANRTLGKIALSRVNRRQPTVIIEHASDISQLLNGHRNINRQETENIPYTPVDDPLQPGHPATIKDIITAVERSRGTWGYQLEDLLEATLAEMRAHNAGCPEACRLAMSDLRHVRYQRRAGADASSVINFADHAINPQIDPSYWETSQSPGLALESVQRIGREIQRRQRQQQPLSESEAAAIIRNGKCRLFHEGKPPAPMLIQQALLARVRLSLQAATASEGETAMLILHHPQAATSLDWEFLTRTNEGSQLHTMVSTHIPPRSGFKQPIPVIANAGVIILRATSRRNLEPILDNAAITDDLSVLTDHRQANIGYIWNRQTGKGGFFEDNP